MAALGSEDEKEVLAAMSLLSEGDQPALLPGVIVFHPSPAVVLHALDLFARDRRTDLGWAARRLFLEHPDDEVRAAALRAQLAVLDDPGVLESALDDRSPVVRAAAVVGLISRGRGDAPSVAAALAALRADSDIAPSSPSPVRSDFSPPHASRLSSSSWPRSIIPTFSSNVSERWPNWPAGDFLVSLVGMLGNRSLRPVARDGLVRIGTPALTFLSDALADRATPFEVRLHIPRSISRFAADQAIPILLRELQREDDGALRFKIVRGLGRLRADAPTTRIDDHVLEQTLREALKEALRLKHWQGVIGVDAGRSRRPRRRLASAPVRSAGGRRVAVG